MKEQYFTPANIAIEAQRLLHSVSRLRAMRENRFSPERSALLILDMQKYFLDESSHAYIPSAPSIIERLQALIQAYSRLGFPVVFTRHLNSPQNAGMMGIWWRDLIDPKDAVSEITEAIDRRVGLVLEKSQYDAFYNTELESELRGNGVEQLMICGVMTHLCCETTARSAFVRGFEVFFTVDGTATYNRAFHEAAILNLSHGFATPVLVEEVLESLRVHDERG